MTVEEKLDKAVDFIRSIENMSLPIMKASSILDSSNVYCDCCGECDALVFDGIDEKYVELSKFEELKDKAWHLLADLTN